MNVNGSSDLHPHFIDQSKRFKKLFALNISVPLLCMYFVVSVSIVLLSCRLFI